jgi:hypothetical protein
MDQFRRHPNAFTLIEVMVVIGIMMMIMAIGIPSIVSVLSKDPIRQGVSDVLEACSHARAQAIISGVPAEVRFRPKDYSISVELAAPAAPETAPEAAGMKENAEPTPSLTGPAAPFSAHLSEELVIEMLDVNFSEYKDADEVRARFFPNGTCDELTIVLQWPKQQAYRKITLDIISGLADVEVMR